VGERGDHKPLANWNTFSGKGNIQTSKKNLSFPLGGKGGGEGAGCYWEGFRLLKGGRALSSPEEKGTVIQLFLCIDWEEMGCPNILILTVDEKGKRVVSEYPKEMLLLLRKKRKRGSRESSSRGKGEENLYFTNFGGEEWGCVLPIRGH